MRIKAIKCSNCKDTIYSRTEMDFRECSCASVSTNGGQTYTKYDIVNGSLHEKIIINIDISARDLYNDWKEMVDSYGLIKEIDMTTVKRHIIC